MKPCTLYCYIEVETFNLICKSCIENFVFESVNLSIDSHSFLYPLLEISNTAKNTHFNYIKDWKDNLIITPEYIFFSMNVSTIKWK